MKCKYLYMKGKNEVFLNLRNEQRPLLTRYLDTQTAFKPDKWTIHA